MCGFVFARYVLLDNTPGSICRVPSFAKLLIADYDPPLPCFLFDDVCVLMCVLVVVVLVLAWGTYSLGAGPQAHGGGGEWAEGEGGDLQPLRVLGQDVRAHDVLLQWRAV